MDLATAEVTRLWVVSKAARDLAGFLNSRIISGEGNLFWLLDPNQPLAEDLKGLIVSADANSILRLVLVPEELETESVKSLLDLATEWEVERVLLDLFFDRLNAELPPKLEELGRFAKLKAVLLHTLPQEPAYYMAMQRAELLLLPDNAWGNRSCVALGAQVLSVVQSSILSYLTSRFQQEVFAKGFVQEPSLPATARDKLNKDARTILAAARTVLALRFAGIIPIKADQFPSGGGESERIANVCDLLRRAITIAEEAGLADARTDVDACRDGQRTGLDSALLLSGRLAGGAVYLQQLDGALKELRHELCYRFLAQSAATYCQVRLGEMFPLTAPLNKLPLSPFNPFSVVREMILRIENASAHNCIPERLLIVFHLCTNSFSLLEEHLRTDTPVARLVEQLLERFISAASDLWGQTLKNSQQRSELNAALLKSQNNWFRKLTRGSNPREQELAHERSELDKKSVLLRDTMLWMEGFMRGLVETVLIPYAIRSRVVAEIRNEYLMMKGETASFQQHTDLILSSRIGLSTPTEQLSESATSQTWVENWYNEVTKLISWTRCADEALHPGLIRYSSRELSGGGSLKNLRDYFYIGAHSLADRIAEYASTKFSRLQAQDAITVLEMDGGETIYRTLAAALAKNAPLANDLTFNQEKIAFPSARIVRCHPAVARHLRDEEPYKQLFLDHDQFCDAEDGQELEILTITNLFTLSDPAAIFPLPKAKFKTP